MEAITSSCERTQARKGAGKLSQTGVNSLLLFPFFYPQIGKMEMCLLYIPGDQNEKKEIQNTPFWASEGLKKKKSKNTIFIISGIQKGFLKKPICWYAH